MSAPRKWSGGVTESWRDKGKSLRRNTPALHYSKTPVFVIMANAPELELKEGDDAPVFTALTNGGGRVSLVDFKGKNVVLYFYPRDDTPGCTKEACAFRDHFGAF